MKTKIPRLDNLTLKEIEQLFIEFERRLIK